jgi:urease accessory protein
MTVIEHIYREADLPEAQRVCARDTITLGWEERVQAHGRRRSDGGLEFGLALPRGSVLRGGDCLVVDEARTIVVVVEQPQPVFVIEPGAAPDWALYAYHIGNRHQPLMITGTSIVCPDAPGVEQLLRQQHIPHTRALLPFTPATANVPHPH